VDRSKYDVIIGLEIHIQTKTKSKMFCSCPTNYFNNEPNTHVCPTCLGLPGALPVPNKRAIELCILMGLATQCDIHNEIHFDRKHYFYPDLPKGYQISQYKDPICSNGKHLCLYAAPGEKTEFEIVEIERIHQEEDVAKSTHHTESNGQEYTLIDYNKSGVPLIEIVTKPCITSARVAYKFATDIQNIARYYGVSDADMEKGQMRCEPNISVQRKGTWKRLDNKIVPINEAVLNPKVEIKNIGSISAVEKAINYEVNRLIDEIEQGKEIVQQTRGWDAVKGKTVFQRSKESADDYRYMPDPDIPIIEITQKDIERIKETMPENSYKKYCKYNKDWEISDHDAYTLVFNGKDTYEYFEDLQAKLSTSFDTKVAAQEASNWFLTTVLSISNESGNKDYNSIATTKDLAQLIEAFKNNILTRNKAEELLRESIEKKKNLGDLISNAKKHAKDITGNIDEIVQEVIDSNPKAVDDYKAGKEASIGYLVGQVMQKTKGSADPNSTRSILIEKING